ncbi:hypothetical protein EYC80_009858 [Monilinia laxa]|uniref:Uncharacterized protein n=1 Tax=Monilinia laxa TaxID=61186 RepID=A0A5N6JSP1_MONLA|nr:hypothetical protein EYC80_009858 [Monilinia laxa]
MSPSKPTPKAEGKKKAVLGAKIKRKITTGTKHTTSPKGTGDNVGKSRVKPIETLASEPNMVTTKTDENNAELMDQDIDMNVDKIQGNIFFHLRSALENTAANITDVMSSKFANTRPASNVELTDQDTEMRESYGNIFSHLQDALESTKTNITSVMSANFATKRPASNIGPTDRDTEMKESHGNVFSYIHSAIQQTEVNITGVMRAVVAKVDTAKAESVKTKPASKGLDTQEDLKVDQDGNFCAELSNHDPYKRAEGVSRTFCQ